MFENPELLDEEDLELEQYEQYNNFKLPKDYLSYSQISLYHFCGEKYRRKYVLGKRRPASSNMAQGRMVHHIVEEMLLYKRDKQEIPPVEFHEDLLAEEIDEFFEDVETWDEKVPDKQNARETSSELLKIYRNQRLPDARVRDTELKIQTTFRDKIPFVGYIDLVEKGSEEENTVSDDPLFDPYEIQPTDRVRDLKVTGRTYPKGRVENSLQLTLYSEILDVEDVGFDLLVQTKKPKFVAHRAERSSGDKEHALDVVEDTAEAISAGVFPRTDPDHWMCSKKWCPFWDDCRGKYLSTPNNDEE